MGVGVVAPRRQIMRSWRARRSLAWEGSGRLAISSRNRVPPLAASNLPALGILVDGLHLAVQPPLAGLPQGRPDEVALQATHIGLGVGDGKID